MLLDPGNPAVDRGARSFSEDLSVLVREMHPPKTNNCICRVVIKALEKNQVGSRDTKIGQGLCYTGLPKVRFQQRGEENTSHAGTEGRARRRREE